MTKADCGMLMASIKANYPAYHAKTDKETRLAAINIMAVLLEDLPRKDCEMALLHYMSQPNEFPPNAGQIRFIVSQFHSPFNTLNMIPQISAYCKELQANAITTVETMQVYRFEDGDEF
jgi:hypothetical protein